jgi:hypothetical protein
VQEEIPIQLSEAEPNDGNVSTLELICILTLAKQCDPTSVFEIGTFDGRTTLNLALNTRPEAQIYTLDLPAPLARNTPLPRDRGDAVYQHESPGHRFRGKSCAGKIRQLLGDSATFDFGPFKHRVDFVFIDGAHSRAYVLNDSAVALGMAHDERSILLWHDYGVWPGVTQALNQLYQTRGERWHSMRHIKGTSLVYWSGSTG